ncbi:MAG: GNAT family N-acetyltransferase [Wenzhouxiangellaceae bacterium]
MNDPGPENRPDSAATADSLQWRLQAFEELSPAQLYALLVERVAVFVVEQNCAYPELDGRDPKAMHLSAWAGEHAPVAYARILPPGSRFDQPSIGRVLTVAGVRATGLGRELMARAIDATRQRWPGTAICVSAQRHLEGFYASLGFATISPPYDEDGIEHVDMQLPAAG